jgi:ABC-type phosphate/phosphonate transport system substrate-binding protein
VIAALPMYDWPVLQPANDRFWRALAERLRDAGITAPWELTRQDDHAALWERDDLLLAQTCGLPFNTGLKDRVRYVATPVHTMEGCREARYSSAVVARRDVDPVLRTPDALRGLRLAINGTDSWSGYEVVKRWFAAGGTPMPAPHLVSGGHLPSMQAVAERRADFAAIDAIALGLAWRHLPELAGHMQVIGWTESRPAPPFVTAGSAGDESVATLRTALHDALASEPGIREALGLRGVAVLADDAYEAMIPAEAQAAIS